MVRALASRGWLLLCVGSIIVVGCAERDAQVEEAPGPEKKQPAQKPSSPEVTSVDRPPATVEEAEKALQSAVAELESIYGAAGEAVPLGADDGDRCGRACPAFASLLRAADGLCRLASEGDERCVRARALVDEHRKRGAACNCPAPPP